MLLSNSNFAQTNILENRAGIASPIPPLDPRMEKNNNKKRKKNNDSFGQFGPRIYLDIGHKKPG